MARRRGGGAAAAAERDAKSDKGAELGMIRIKKVEEVRSECVNPLWENEEGPGAVTRRAQFSVDKITI